MKGERGYIVKVRFLTYPSEGSEPSIGKKDYHYFMCDELVNRLADEANNQNSIIAQTPIKITNNKGYNYNGGECIIIGRTFIPDELWKTINLEKSSLYREIVKIELGAAIDYITFRTKALRLFSSESFIDRDSIFRTLILEGAMPKEGIPERTMCDNITTATTITTDHTITNNSCGRPDLTSVYIGNSYYPYYDYTTGIPPTALDNGIGLNTAKLAGTKIEKKEDKNMFDNIMKDMKFGPATDVKFSIYGPAFNSGDKWLARHESEWVDVSDMLFEAPNLCYMMPAAKSMVEEGDFILHKGKWARVECISEEDHYIWVEKINEQEVVQILPTKNMFGFDYYTKLICPIEGFEGADGFGATTNNPFGMLPFIMAMKDGKKDNLLPFMLMSGKMDMSNPMMLMMLGGDSSNLGLMMAMMAMEKKNK